MNKSLGTHTSKIKAPMSPAFKAWFGGSKAVDSNGDPLVLFHGTKAPPSQFKPIRDGVSSNALGSWTTERHGIFLAEDPVFAEEFATQGEGANAVGASIMPLYLRARNPIDLTESGTNEEFETMRSLADQEGLEGYSFAHVVFRDRGTLDAWQLFDADSGWEPDLLIRILKQMGYDSALLEEFSEGGASGRTWVAFDPSQVKSAIGNVGTYDPENEEIVASKSKHVGVHTQRLADYSYSSTQINLPKELASKIKVWTRETISKEDLYDDPEDPTSSGFEDHLHCTLLYGLTGKDQKVQEQLRELVEGYGSIQATLGKVSIFDGAKKDKPYDVVKLTVESEDLRKLHTKIKKNLPNKETWPTYQPHVTLAYVVVGAGKKYVGLDEFEGEKFELEHFVFAPKEDKKRDVVIRTAEAELESREEKVSRIKELRKLMAPLAEKGGLTSDEAARFVQYNKEISALRYDVVKPLSPDKISPPEERKSALSADVVMAAYTDLTRSRPIYERISEVSSGVYHGANTSLDVIMLGQDLEITAQEFYDNFAGTREALRQQFGSSIDLYRAVGSQMSKPTSFWATTQEYASQFGSNVTSQKVPVDHILAVNVGLNGRYHEVVVGTPPKGGKRVGYSDNGPETKQEYLDDLIEDTEKYWQRCYPSGGYPSKFVVLPDGKKLIVDTHPEIVEHLDEYDGELSFDPNHDLLNIRTGEDDEDGEGEGAGAYWDGTLTRKQVNVLKDWCEWAMVVLPNSPVSLGRHTFDSPGAALDYIQDGRIRSAHIGAFKYDTSEYPPAFIVDTDGTIYPADTKKGEPHEQSIMSLADKKGLDDVGLELLYREVVKVRWAGWGDQHRWMIYQDGAPKVPRITSRQYRTLLFFLQHLVDTGHAKRDLGLWLGNRGIDGSSTVGDVLDTLKEKKSRIVGSSGPSSPLSRLAKIQAPQTHEFKAWFGKSKVVNGDGSPKVVFHGTTHVFSEFSVRNTSPDSFLGRGLYFTDSPKDLENYTGQGPDLTTRLEQSTGKIMRQKGWDYLTYGTQEYHDHYKKALELAKKKLVGPAPSGVAMPVYLKIEKPLYLTEGSGFPLEIEYEEDAEGDIVSEKGSGIKFLQRLQKLCQKYGIQAKDLGVLVSKVYEAIQNGVSTLEMDKLLRSDEGIAYLEDKYGNLVSTTVLKNLYLKSGFDGIIMDADFHFGSGGANNPKGKGMPGTKGALHYIVFDSRQVKSALSNSGEYDPKSKNIGAHFTPRASLTPTEFINKLAQADAAEYGEGYPTKFLVTPQGKVLECWPTHAQAFSTIREKCVEVTGSDLGFEQVDCLNVRWGKGAASEGGDWAAYMYKTMTSSQRRALIQFLEWLTLTQRKHSFTIASDYLSTGSKGYGHSFSCVEEALEWLKGGGRQGSKYLSSDSKRFVAFAHEGLDPEPKNKYVGVHQ